VGPTKLSTLSRLKFLTQCTVKTKAANYPTGKAMVNQAILFRIVRTIEDGTLEGPDSAEPRVLSYDQMKKMADAEKLKRVQAVNDKEKKSGENRSAEQLKLK
jgi:hypothetical protein